LKPSLRCKKIPLQAKKMPLLHAALQKATRLPVAHPVKARMTMRVPAAHSLLTVHPAVTSNVMRKRLIVTMIAASLASGYLVFGNSTGNRISEATAQTCPDECCENGEEDCRPHCCDDAEMCCE
jgi:hypothetical protein